MTNSPSLPAGTTFLALACGMVLQISAAWAASSTSADRIFAVGVVVHDRGFAADEHEDGVDLNLEVRFAPLNFLGAPRPHLGATLNFSGDTSVAYAGLSFQVLETDRWFADALIGVAVHDGPLHKDPVGCTQHSDCGYGVRLLPRFGAEVGYKLRRGASVSVFYDHMSHKWVVSGENEGLDHIGVRTAWRF